MRTSLPLLSATVANCQGPGGKPHCPWPRPATVSSPTAQQQPYEGSVNEESPFFLSRGSGL
eukprot:8155387-Alexandrium_andersonii.AAC.1